MLLFVLIEVTYPKGVRVQKIVDIYRNEQDAIDRVSVSMGGNNKIFDYNVNYGSEPTIGIQYIYDSLQMNHFIIEEHLSNSI